jgi:hypothetical protein
LLTLQYGVVAFLFLGRNVKKKKKKKKTKADISTEYRATNVVLKRRRDVRAQNKILSSENLKTRSQNGCVLNALLLGSVNQQSSEKLSVSRSIYMEHMTVF